MADSLFLANLLLAVLGHIRTPNLLSSVLNHTGRQTEDVGQIGDVKGYICT